MPFISKFQRWICVFEVRAEAQSFFHVLFFRWPGLHTWIDPFVSNRTESTAPPDADAIYARPSFNDVMDDDFVLLDS